MLFRCGSCGHLYKGNRDLISLNIFLDGCPKCGALVPKQVQKLANTLVTDNPSFISQNWEIYCLPDEESPV